MLEETYTSPVNLAFLCQLAAFTLRCPVNPKEVEPSVPDVSSERERASCLKGIGHIKRVACPNALAA